MTEALDDRPSAPGAPPTAQLAECARAGSLPAYAELVRRFEGRLYNFLLRRTHSASEAEEITQEAFVRAWENLGRYDARWQFSTWLFTIARRAAVTAARRRRTGRDGGAAAAAASKVGSGADHVERLADREEAHLLWDLADRQLSERQRSALWLRYAEGMEIREIALVQGTTTLVVRVTLSRARRALARAAGAQGATEVSRAGELAGEPV